MIIILFAGSLLLSMAVFLSFAYKRDERKKIDKKTHKLWFVYGLAMLMVDKFPKKMRNGSYRINTAMRELIVKEDIKKKKYLYIVEKTAICITAFGITLFFVLAICISERWADSEVSTVTRSTKVDAEYQLQIRDKTGRKEQATINVAKKEYTEKQIEEIFEQRQKELVRKVLGKNKSQDKVNQNLNLVTEIGSEKILVSWSISDSKKIGYNGILSKNIGTKGEIVTLTATMTLGKTTRDYSFAVNVFPPIQKNSMGKELQEYLDENELNQEKVELPKEIGGQEVSYEKLSSDMSGYILFIGIVISIALFFLKDIDLKKEVAKRNQQMQNDYPEIVSKILLYYGAGLSIQKTFERIVKGYEEEKRKNKKIYRYAYEELEMCFVKMKSGVSEISAINQYGERCKLHCYVKLAGLIEQNIRRGTKELSLILKSEQKEAMNEKKNNMLKRGGQISTKLLGPMVIMLIVSIVIIMVPAFMSMNV